MASNTLPRPRNKIWAAQVEAWDRSLRAANKAFKTRLNCELAATQLGDYLADLAGSDEPDVDGPDDAAAGPTEVDKAHIEVFLGWMIYSNSTAIRLRRRKSSGHRLSG